MMSAISGKRRIFCFLLAAVFPLFGRESRLTVSVPEKQVTPVILSGKQLLQRASGKVLRDSLQVRTARGQVIPVQVDPRNALGEYAGCKTPYLAPEDEIVFLTVPGDGQKYEILYGDSRRPQDFPQQITTEIPASFTDLALTNSDQLRIEIKASGARPNEKKVTVRETELKSAEASGTNAVPLEHLLLERRKKQAAPSRSTRGDYARGGMVMYFRNCRLTDTGSWENMTIPVQPFGRSRDSAAWSLPEIIVSGPVRKIVRIRHREDLRKDVIKNGLYLRKGFRGKTKVEHCFTIYAKTGIVDFMETVEYANVDLGMLLAYAFPLRLGNVPSCDQLLLIPDDLADGKIRAVPQKDFLPGDLPKNSFYDLYVNPVHRKNLPGYFGYMDKKSKIAAAVFYDPVMSETETTSLTIQGNVENFRKGRADGSNAILAKTVFVGKNGSGKPGIFRIRFRFFADASGNPEAVRSACIFWKNNTPYLVSGGK